MSKARLAAGIEASALLRRAERDGGFGMVLQRGDKERGSLLLAVLERGTHHAFLERTLQATGAYGWSRTGPPADDESKLTQYVESRRRSDPDCWVIELDVPSAERFIAETTSTG